MNKEEANKRTGLQPTPKVLVSCRGKDGKSNALVVAYYGNCSYNPPMVMMGSSLPVFVSHDQRNRMFRGEPGSKRFERGL